MNDKKREVLCLEVRKDIQLDIMNDSTNYTATGRQITPDDPNHETNKKDGTTKTIKYKKIVICPVCNHTFDPRTVCINNFPPAKGTYLGNKKKNKKSNNIHDASSNTEKSSTT
jgi:hypothetical protein